MGGSPRILFLQTLQRRLEKTDLSCKQARTFCFVPLHVALDNKPKCKRPSGKFCSAVKCRDRNRLAVVKDSKSSRVNVLFGRPLLAFRAITSTRTRLDELCNVI